MLSVKVIKRLILLVISFIFIVGCLIFIDGIIEAINLRTVNEFEYNLDDESDKLHENNETNTSTNFTAIIEDRFPSTGAPSVILLFGSITILVSALGVMAVNKEEPSLLSTYSIALVMASLLRIVFFLATICMYAFTVDHNPVRVTTIISAAIVAIELVLIPCVCHFAKTTKRGTTHSNNKQIQQSDDNQTIPPVTTAPLNNMAINKD